MSLSFYMACPEPPTNPLGLDFVWNTPVVDGAVQFTATLDGLSTSDEIKKISWQWNFGDEGGVVDLFRATTQNPNYTFSTYGDFVVTLTGTRPDGVKSVIKKVVNVRYFANAPYATIDSIQPSVFGFTIRGNTFRGEKYEYTDPDPEFFLEISTSPDFDTLVGNEGETSLPLPPGSGFRISYDNLTPNRPYYARIRTIRFSSFKSSLIEDVSNSTTNIVQFNTLAFPEINIAVDTTTNAEVVIIKASIEELEIAEEDKELSIYRDNDFANPVDRNEITYAADSIFYREPGSKLTFIYKFTYRHPTRNFTLTTEKSIEVYTPNVIFQINDSIIRSETIFTLGKRLTNFNNSRQIIFDGLNLSIIWNRSPGDDGVRLGDDEFSSQSYRVSGVYFLKPNLTIDFHSYLVYSVNNISNYHEGRDALGQQTDFGTMQVYREDDEYIYVRMRLPIVGSQYRTGFEMAIVSNNGQQSLAINTLKGFVFKVRKVFN